MFFHDLKMSISNFVSDILKTPNVSSTSSLQKKFFRSHIFFLSCGTAAFVAAAAAAAAAAANAKVALKVARLWAVQGQSRQTHERIDPRQCCQIFRFVAVKKENIFTKMVYYFVRNIFLFCNFFPFIQKLMVDLFVCQLWFYFFHK